MSIRLSATKLVVHDVDAAERFYQAIGLKVLGHNVGGEGDVRQQQCFLSATDDGSAHLLVLSQFLDLPPAPPPVFPGEVWLAFAVSDVEATVRCVEAAGGRTVRAGEDRLEHGVRAAVVSDPEGHFIELVGPLTGAAPRIV